MGACGIMDMIARKKRIMMMQKSNVLDTSPVIIQNGVKYPNGNPETNPLIADEICSITDYYDVPFSTMSALSVTDYGLYGNIISFNGDTYRDWWGADSRNAEQTKTGIPSRSTRSAFTVVTSMIDDCYCYITSTGQIVFAGKNSIYYGHRNISELE